MSRLKKKRKKVGYGKVSGAFGRPKVLRDRDMQGAMSILKEYTESVKVEQDRGFLAGLKKKIRGQV